MKSDKRKRLDARLQLVKETIRQLNGRELKRAVGGGLQAAGCEVHYTRPGTEY